jgi:hypothetical protein
MSVLAQVAGASGLETEAVLHLVEICALMFVKHNYEICAFEIMKWLNMFSFSWIDE